MENSAAAKAHRLSKSKPTSLSTAITQNEEAAAEYARASDGIDDSEALRVLKLLEEHHLRLANLVKSANEQHSKPQPLDHKPDSLAPAENVAPLAANTSSPATSSSRGAHEARAKPREWATSSIASNLASARGIPSTPSSQQRIQHAQSASEKLRAQQKQSPKRPDSVPTAATSTREETVNGNEALTTGAEAEGFSVQSASDAAFNKFYNTFEGLVSKLSAPLAFAGLPLSPKEPAKPNPSETPTSPASQKGSAPNDSEVQRIFSKAAIRALQDANGAFPGVQESFLVVPGTTTSPYNKMLASDVHEDDSHEIFVDAPGSPSTSRRSLGGKGATTNKTVEELELENAQLKSLTDKISRRLYDWEKTAQKQGAALLQQSVKLSGSTASAGGTGTGTGTGTTTNSKPPEGDARVAEVEAQMKALQKEIERYSRENEKLKTVVVRYRERWDKLKEGARTRRETSDVGTRDQ